MSESDYYRDLQNKMAEAAARSEAARLDLEIMTGCSLCGRRMLTGDQVCDDGARLLHFMDGRPSIVVCGQCLRNGI